jgi:hypothetical protein
MYQSSQEDIKRGINDLLISTKVSIPSDALADNGNRSVEGRYIQMSQDYRSKKQNRAEVWQAGESDWNALGRILMLEASHSDLVPPFDMGHWQILPTPTPAPVQQPSLLPLGRITGQVKLIQSVARAWDTNDDELARLLGYQSPAYIRDILEGKRTFAGNEDRFDRARIMYKIHSTLARLFVDATQEAKWIRVPNIGLQNISPLDCMLSRRIPGMVAVLQYVELDVALRR